MSYRYDRTYHCSRCGSEIPEINVGLPVFVCPKCEAFLSRKSVRRSVIRERLSIIGGLLVLSAWIFLLLRDVLRAPPGAPNGTPVWATALVVFVVLFLLAGFVFGVIYVVNWFRRR
jgi:hypothetical protein